MKKLNGIILLISGLIIGFLIGNNIGFKPLISRGALCSYTPVYLKKYYKNEAYSDVMLYMAKTGIVKKEEQTLLWASHQNRIILSDNKLNDSTFRYYTVSGELLNIIDVMAKFNPKLRESSKVFK